MTLGHDLSKGQRTQDVKISQDVTFDTMLLKSETWKGLKRAGFLKPSPIQLHGIPLGKCGFDLLLEAKSGTGKTAVFTVIALEKLDLNQGVQTLVLAPTREIAAQISDVITNIGHYYKGLNVGVVLGGLPYNEDVEKFSKNVHIVVGSPGRLRHLMHNGHIDISKVRLFVLDEADKLMESSFQPDINYIFSKLQKQKQVIMSSATYPSTTKSFIQKYVQKAQHVCPDSNSILLGIKQKVIKIAHHSNIVVQIKRRYEQLKKVLTEKQFKQCLIFCNYQARVGELHRMLARDKWPAEQLYGQQQQTDRLDALKTLQEYKCRILISTDLAARGIDAANVDIVINFEPPHEWQTYLHRIGRAGRYGSYGTAITLLSEGKEEKKFKDTLLSSNMMFNLSDFWTDEFFNLSLNNVNESTETVSEPIILPEPTVQEKVNNGTSLWEILIDSSEKSDGQQMYSFAGLCDSFKNSSELRISTFDNLMQSFSKANQDTVCRDNRCKYKNVKLNKLPFGNFDKFYNLEIDLHQKQEYDKNYIESDDMISNKNPARKQDFEAPFLDKNENITNTSNCEMKSNNNNPFENSASGAQKQINSKNQSFIKKSEETDINQAIIDAGLPTAFGKSKYKKDHKHTSNLYYSNKNKANVELKKSALQYKANKSQYDTDINFHKVTPAKIDNHPSMLSNKADPTIKSEPSLSDTDEENGTDPSDSEPENEPIFNSKKCFQTSNSNHYSHGTSHQSRESKNRVQNRAKTFDLWYTQLKHQMQYIQYALYIEEMRK